MSRNSGTNVAGRVSYRRAGFDTQMQVIALTVKEQTGGPLEKTRPSFFD